jgi:GST-like protein
MQWLFWQMGGLGPMLGQNLHFGLYAPDKLDYAITRYVDETARLFRVLDTRLADRDYLAGKYSIADMACYPWVLKAEALQQDIAEFPHLQGWFERIAARPATQRAYEIGAGINTVPTITEESKKFLLQSGGTTVAA